MNQLRFNDDKAMIKQFTYNIDEINNVAKQINSFGAEIILLYGELGAGKTALAREIICNLLNDFKLRITSPTFNIVNVYSKGDLNIAHFDLYRISSLDELYEIGIEEFLNNSICIIEWPQIIQKNIEKNMRKKKVLKIEIQQTNMEKTSERLLLVSNPSLLL